MPFTTTPPPFFFGLEDDEEELVEEEVEEAFGAFFPTLLCVLVVFVGLRVSDCK